tara:strand:- start:1501 stop:1899 length:399 start_codon:yes stop_codon:yes gene_type:complete
MAAKRKNRFWSDDEKRSICDQARAEEISVAQVACRYAMNANLIHKWLRDPRFAPASPGSDVDATEATTFLPVEIEGVVSSPLAPDMPVYAQTGTGPLSAYRVDITLSDGRRILIEGTTALPAVLALIEGLVT